MEVQVLYIYVAHLYRKEKTRGSKLHEPKHSLYFVIYLLCLFSFETPFKNIPENASKGPRMSQLLRKLRHAVARNIPEEQFHCFLTRTKSWNKSEKVNVPRSFETTQMECSVICYLFHSINSIVFHSLPSVLFWNISTTWEECTSLHSSKIEK